MFFPDYEWPSDNQFPKPPSGGMRNNTKTREEVK